MLTHVIFKHSDLIAESLTERQHSQNYIERLLNYGFKDPEALVL